MSEWISVKDRLPETLGTYIAGFSNGAKSMEVMYDPRAGWHHIMSYSKLQPTHWMTLPEAPK